MGRAGGQRRKIGGEVREEKEREEQKRRRRHRGPVSCTAGHEVRMKVRYAEIEKSKSPGAKVKVKRQKLEGISNKAG